MKKLLRHIKSFVARKPNCNLCGGTTRRRRGYGRPFAECIDCGFIYALDFNAALLSEGMGLEGSWTGPGEGGYREYFLVRMLAKDLGGKRFLLYGTGYTSALPKLLSEGFDVIGADISPEVVSKRRAELGDDRFYDVEDIPADLRFDGIVAVEVFEHLPDPHRSFHFLANRLSESGIICGTTNFYPGGPIEDGTKPGYMSLSGHVAYWSKKSLSRISKQFNLDTIDFEMIRPGSVLPDEKYGQLYPNKRVFFIYPPSIHGKSLKELVSRTPILPIDRA